MGVVEGDFDHCSFDRTRHYFPETQIKKVVDSIFKTITSKTGQVK